MDSTPTQTPLDTTFDSTYWLDEYNRTKVESYTGSKEVWNKRAASFAKKDKTNSYIAQLISLLELDPGDSVFDMGAGAGALSVPLAQAGHEVFAVDFSERMLEETERHAGKESVTIKTFERSWQEDWDDLPKADVAVASRSLTGGDLAQSLAKLESKSRKRVAITVGTGCVPWLDRNIHTAIGHDDISASVHASFIALVNYLFAIGRMPRIDYITYPHHWGAPTKEGLRENLTTMFCRTDTERALLQRFLDDHTVTNESGRFVLDYTLTVTWGFIGWAVP